MAIKHCNKAECITTRRMGGCECYCLDCNQNVPERTTLDTQLEARVRLDAAEYRFAHANGLLGQPVMNIRRKFIAAAQAGSGEDWDKYQTLCRVYEQPHVPHAFIRSSGRRLPGPPEETCDICGTDPRNVIHTREKPDTDLTPPPLEPPPIVEMPPFHMMSSSAGIVGKEWLLPPTIRQLFDEHGIKSEVVGRAADGTLEVEASVPNATEPTVYPLPGDGAGMGREETDTALRARIKATIEAGGVDKLGRAYVDVREAMRNLELAMLGRNPHDPRDTSLTVGQIKEMRQRYCKIAVADLMFLLERIKEEKV